MRTPVRQIRGKPHQETTEDLLADALAKTYTVVRNKTFGSVDAAGEKKSLLVDITLPEHKLMIEVQRKQDNKELIAEMAREKVARNHGWGVCRFTEKEISGDIDTVLYKVQREIERRRR